MFKTDKVRFKELSEGFMQEVAQLEAQLEAADMKPKSKQSSWSSRGSQHSYRSAPAAPCWKKSLC